MILIKHVRCLERPMRITGEQGIAAGSVLTGDDPVIAAAIQLGHQIDAPRTAFQCLEAVSAGP